MNERLKELMLLHNIPIKERRVDAEGNGYYVPNHAGEKFAEAIVRECAELFVDQRYMILNPLEPFAYERVRVLKEHDKDTVKKIKQHFGVEE